MRAVHEIVSAGSATVVSAYPSCAPISSWMEERPTWIAGETAVHHVHQPELVLKSPIASVASVLAVNVSRVDVMTRHKTGMRATLTAVEAALLAPTERDAIKTPIVALASVSKASAQRLDVMIRHRMVRSRGSTVEGDAVRSVPTT